jgi:hypothetical protein
MIDACIDYQVIDGRLAVRFRGHRLQGRRTLRTRDPIERE